MVVTWWIVAFCAKEGQNICGTIDVVIDDVDQAANFMTLCQMILNFPIDDFLQHCIDHWM